MAYRNRTSESSKSFSQEIQIPWFFTNWGGPHPTFSNDTLIVWPEGQNNVSAIGTYGQPQFISLPLRFIRHTDGFGSLAHAIGYEYSTQYIELIKPSSVQGIRTVTSLYIEFNMFISNFAIDWVAKLIRTQEGSVIKVNNMQKAPICPVIVPTSGQPVPDVPYLDANGGQLTRTYFGDDCFPKEQLIDTVMFTNTTQKYTDSTHLMGQDPWAYVTGQLQPSFPVEQQNKMILSYPVQLGEGEGLSLCFSNLGPLPTEENPSIFDVQSQDQSYDLRYKIAANWSFTVTY